MVHLHDDVLKFKLHKDLKIDHALITLLLLLLSTSIPVMAQSNFKPPTETQQAQADPPENHQSETAEHAGGQNQCTSANSDDDDDEQTMFYAFLKEDSSQLGGPLYEFFKNKPIVREILNPHTRMERKFRPMLQWRRWADRHQPFIPSFLFLGTVGFVLWFLLPSVMQSAAEECRSSFWKCFGTGLVIAIITMVLLRAIFLSQLGWPLGIVIAGCSQAAMLSGLSLAIYNLGHAVLLLVQYKKISAIANSPSLARASDIVMGALLAAIVLQIPAFGILPRPGTRLLALFGLLGIGAIFRAIRRRTNTSVVT